MTFYLFEKVPLSPSLSRAGFSSMLPLDCLLHQAVLLDFTGHSIYFTSSAYTTSGQNFDEARCFFLPMLKLFSRFSQFFFSFFFPHSSSSWLLYILPWNFSLLLKAAKKSQQNNSNNKNPLWSAKCSAWVWHGFTIILPKKMLLHDVFPFCLTLL